MESDDLDTMIEKLVQRLLAETDQTGRAAAAEALHRRFKGRGGNYADIRVRVNGSAGRFPLIEHLRNTVNQQFREIDYFRQHSSPELVKKAAQAAGIENRWPEFEKLIRTRITGDDPEKGELSSGWRTGLAQLLNMGSSIFAKWQDGTAQIPESVFDTLRQALEIKKRSARTQNSKGYSVTGSTLSFGEAVSLYDRIGAFIVEIDNHTFDLDIEARELLHPSKLYDRVVEINDTLKTFGRGQDEEARGWASEKLDLLNDTPGLVIKFGPHIDSSGDKPQRRLQCTINKNKFIEIFAKWEVEVPTKNKKSRPDKNGPRWSPQDEDTLFEIIKRHPSLTDIEYAKLCEVELGRKVEPNTIKDRIRRLRKDGRLSQGRKPFTFPRG